MFTYKADKGDFKTLKHFLFKKIQTNNDTGLANKLKF